MNDEFEKYEEPAGRRQRRKNLSGTLTKNNFWVAAAALTLSAISNHQSNKKNRELISGQNAQSRADFAPFLATGKKANTQLDNILLNGDISSLENDPLIQNQLQQANQASNRSSAARGRLGSGANAVDLLRRSGNVYDSRINQLLTLSGRGQQGTQTQAAFNQNATNSLIKANNDQSDNVQNTISNAYFAYLQNRKK